MTSKKKRDYKKIQARIEELAAKVKNIKATPEEKIELKEQRELIRRHAADERIKAAKAALAEGKKAALLRILNANNIKTENDLKDILRYVQDTRPGFIPVRREATAETPNEDGGSGATEPKNGNADEGASATKSQTGSPVCEKCGATAERRHAKKRDQDYYICPNYSKEDNGHFFQWM